MSFKQSLPTLRDELEHPTSLKVYLYARSKYPQDVGVREVQRKLELKSPSISSWHLEKLENAGFLQKLSSNRFRITPEEAKRKRLELPTKISIKIFKGLFIPPMFLLLGFLITMSVMTFIFLWIDRELASYYGIFGLVVGALLCLYEYSKTLRKIRKYTKIPKKQEEN